VDIPGTATTFEFMFQKKRNTWVVVFTRHIMIPVMRFSNVRQNFPGVEAQQAKSPIVRKDTVSSNAGGIMYGYQPAL